MPLEPKKTNLELNKDQLLIALETPTYLEILGDALVAEHVVALGDDPVLLSVLTHRALDHLRRQRPMKVGETHDQRMPYHARTG